MIVSDISKNINQKLFVQRTRACVPGCDYRESTEGWTHDEQ